MKERPIIFNAEMVRAVLDGRKTQTRRVIKPQPELTSNSGFKWKGYLYGRGFSYQETCWNFLHKCPYGQPGDRLWVRESHMSIDNRDGGRIITYKAGGQDFVFRAGAGDDDWRGNSKWTPSIHMRREHSRILIEVLNVRVERIQDISEDNAKAEGASPSIVGDALDCLKYRAGFQTLWDSINANRGYSWEADPWVWVIEFRRIVK